MAGTCKEKRLRSPLAPSSPALAFSKSKQSPRPTPSPHLVALLSFGIGEEKVGKRGQGNSGFAEIG